MARKKDTDCGMSQCEWGGGEVDSDVQFKPCLFASPCVRVCASGVPRKLSSEGDVAYRKLDPGRMGVFNISKVSSRDTQRHKRVMGDADGSVNSAGG